MRGAPLDGQSYPVDAGDLRLAAHRIADGDLRYVLAGSAGALGSGGGAGGVGSGGDTGSTSAEIRAWVRENCTAMTDAAASGIYDCTP